MVTAGPGTDGPLYTRYPQGQVENSLLECRQLSSVPTAGTQGRSKAAPSHADLPTHVLMVVPELQVIIKIKITTIGGMLPVRQTLCRDVINALSH